MMVFRHFRMRTGDDGAQLETLFSFMIGNK